MLSEGANEYHIHIILVRTVEPQQIFDYQNVLLLSILSLLIIIGVYNGNIIVYVREKNIIVAITQQLVNS